VEVSLPVASRELINLIRIFPNVKEIRGGRTGRQMGIFRPDFPRFTGFYPNDLGIIRDHGIWRIG